MFDSITQLFTFDFSNWISQVVSTFTTYYEDAEGNITETIANIPWSALVPWEQVFAFIMLVIFIIVIFKFLRSVICRVL